MRYNFCMSKCREGSNVQAHNDPSGSPAGHTIGMFRVRDRKHGPVGTIAPANTTARIP